MEILISKPDTKNFCSKPVIDEYFKSDGCFEDDTGKRRFEMRYFRFDFNEEQQKISGGIYSQLDRIKISQFHDTQVKNVIKKCGGSFGTIYTGRCGFQDVILKINHGRPETTTRELKIMKLVSVGPELLGSVKWKGQEAIIWPNTNPIY